MQLSLLGSLTVDLHIANKRKIPGQNNQPRVSFLEVQVEGNLKQVQT
ncbi:hypothetical protein BVRB_5g107180 isoform B [Beta vulgaris subsp. vulgaris]|nr:hypothetical protein BVRB_5g107180 isoform B [Beta vulgaris subsp. vulgaris]